MRKGRDIDKLLSQRASYAKNVLTVYKAEIATVCLRLSKHEYISEKEIEHLFDAIIDYCFDMEIADLFNKLCEAAVLPYPELVKDYRRYYADQWQ